jgi:hypothetical protein
VTALDRSLPKLHSAAGSHHTCQWLYRGAKMPV